MKAVKVEWRDQWSADPTYSSLWIYGTRIAQVQLGKGQMFDAIIGEDKWPDIAIKLSAAKAVVEKQLGVFEYEPK